jgi:hypothetical protein
MAIKLANIFDCKTLQNFTQIGIFGFKIYHLATLLTYIIFNKGSRPPPEQQIISSSPGQSVRYVCMYYIATRLLFFLIFDLYLRKIDENKMTA